MNSITEQLIRELADKLGVSLEKLWATLIVQAKYSTICDLTSMVVCFVLTIFLFRYLIKLLKQKRIEEVARIVEKYSDTDDKTSESTQRTRNIQREIGDSSWPSHDQIIFITVLIGIVIFGFITLLYISILPNLITRLLNPEFGAIEILRQFINVR